MRPWLGRTALAGVAAGLIAACSGGDATGPGGGNGNGNGGGSGTFTIAVTPASPSLAPNGAAVVTITIGRSGGFTGAVTLTVQGVPAGLTAALAQATTTAASTTLSLTAAGTVAAGTYNLTVRGSASGLSDQAAALQVTVTAAGGGGGGTNVSLDWSACAASVRPIWFAYQDGDGPWTRVTGNGHVYQFTVNAARGGYAWAAQNGAVVTVAVQLSARAELGTGVFCALPATKTVTGSVAGIANDNVNVWLGGGAGLASQAAPNFTIVGVHEGAQDLWAWRRTLAAQGGSPDRGLVRRDLNIPANGSVGVLDFNGADAFTPASAQLTITGLAQGEIATHGVNYYSGAGCRFAAFYQGGVGPSPQTMLGVPAALQRPTDYHQLGVTAIAGVNGTRAIQEWFRTLAQRTVALPAALPVPTITTLTGPYARLQASFQLPAEYTAVLLNYGDAARQRGVHITATTGWLGGSNATLTMPDFTGVAGWTNGWAPTSGAAGTWITQGIGSNIANANLCVEGGRIVTAQRTANY